MPVCARIIATEAQRNGWLWQITQDDIQRILARYKEHVSHWDIRMEVIQAELKAFTEALDLGHNYFEIATLFDVSPAKRLPQEYG